MTGTQASSSCGLEGLYQHHVAYAVALIGGLLSLIVFLGIQMGYWVEQLAFLKQTHWQAWLAFALGLLFTASAATITYLYSHRLGVLKDYTLQLERSNRDLDSFASIASHDLKEPLRTIQSYTEIALKRESLSQKGEHYLDTVKEASHHMQEMLHHIRHYARIGDKIDKHDEIICMKRLVDQPLIAVPSSMMFHFSSIIIFQYLAVYFD